MADARVADDSSLDFGHVSFEAADVFIHASWNVIHGLIGS
jgi:hypothetical protein